MLSVPHFISLGHLLSQTDLVATMTESLAASLVKPFNLAYVLHPAKLQAIPITLFWHAKVHRSPIHQWLRELIIETFGQDSTRVGAISV